MLFILESSILNIDPTCKKQSRGLETLIGAYQSCDHMLFVDMKDLDSLKQKLNGVLSYSSKEVLNLLHNRLPQYKQLMDSIDYKVYVYIEDESRQSILRVGNSWYVPLEYFANSGLVPTAILGEDEADAELYLIFARHYAEKEKIKGFPPVARLKGGGGANTPKALISYLRTENSPCICITDSDKLHPGYKSSSTVKKCYAAANSVKLKVVEYVCIEEREAENIIPIDALKKFSKVMQFLGRIESDILPNDEALKYIDFKKGINLEWVSRQDVGTKDYWKKAGSFLSKRRIACGFCRDLPEEEKARCVCGNIAGLGDGVLTDALGYFNARETRLTLRDLLSDTRWHQLGKKVYEFSVSPNRELMAA